ncbi:ATP-binding protein [Novosphingobium sp. BL-8A]|uniref:PAS domain-containing sensor histidine kinase n=1 Tax=Novosphingobium sp. BL-8A TaxID=3127639 RepID=UPI0037578473
MQHGPQSPERPDLAAVSDIHGADLPCFRIDIGGLRPYLANWQAQLPALPGEMDSLLSRTRIVDLNEAAVHLIFPYSARGGITDSSLADVWPRESQSDLADLILAVALCAPKAGREEREVHSLVLERPSLAVWRDEGGQDELFFSVSGQLKKDRTYYQLWTSEARFRRLIHYLPVALLQVDATAMEPIWKRLRAEGVTDLFAYLDAHPELVEFSCGAVHVTDANHHATTLFGLDDPELLLTSVEYLFAHAHDTARRVMNSHFKGDRSHTEITRIARYDGELRDVRISVTYPTAPELLDITMISLEDVTTRLQTEAQLRQIQADFTHAARIYTLGELTTSIAHEVNQPLAAIVTNADASLRWLGRAAPDLTKIQHLTSRIAANARRAGDIIQRIRGMAAKRRPERVLLDLNAIVEEALLFVRHDIENRSITLSTTLATVSPRVLGDRIELQQVLVNLLLNSAQALENGEHLGGRHIIVVTRTNQDGTAVVVICDNGPGIPPEHFERIFDGFFSTKDGGMGIGLSICESIIAAHQGRIEISNRADGGAKVEVTIPGV